MRTLQRQAKIWKQQHTETEMSRQEVQKTNTFKLHTGPRHWPNYTRQRGGRDKGQWHADGGQQHQSGKGIQFQTRFLLLFLPNNHGTKENPDRGNLHSVRAYVMHFQTVILPNGHLKIWQSFINKLAKTFIVLVTSLICSVYLHTIANLLCHAMPCFVMTCTMPCTMCYTAPSADRN